MKRIFSLILTTLIAIPLLSPLQGLAAEQPEPPFDGYLVRLNETEVHDNLSLLSAEDCLEVSEGLYLVDDLETVRSLDQMGLVSYYEPNYRLELLEGEDYTPNQWSLLAANAQAAWTHTDAVGQYDMRGAGVTVAVIDSGIYTEHPDFCQENLLEDYDLANAGVDGWHGTFVAGVIAAQVGNGLGTDGVAPDVTLLPIGITKNGDATIAMLIQAIDYAVEQGVDVINISLGSKARNESLEEACRRALDAGIIVVAAGGNYNAWESQSSSTYMYPASFDGVVSVSACKQDGAGAVFDSSYSYFNDKITVAAPGSGIQSLYPGGGTAVKNGTSFAAPMVTAMAAMAKQRSRDLTPEVFTHLLRLSATDLGEPGYDIYYGYGLVDIGTFAQVLDRQYAITFHLGAEDAAFSPEVQVPDFYTLGQEDIPLLQPIRPGYRFLGWYETEDCSALPVGSIPAGSIGEKTYYAAWEEIELCYFAQYDAHGHMLSIVSLAGVPDGVPDTEINPDAVLGKLFRLSPSGAPLQAAQSFPLNSAG